MRFVREGFELIWFSNPARFAIEFRDGMFDAYDVDGKRKLLSSEPCLDDAKRSCKRIVRDEKKWMVR